MTEVIILPVAYCKVVLHALKYPHCAINGVLVGRKKKDGRTIVLDAVPFFHRWLSLTPMLEVALCQVDVFCEDSSEHLSIVGYYQANEHIGDNNPDVVAFRVAEKIQTAFADAFLLMIRSGSYKIQIRKSKPHSFTALMTRFLFRFRFAIENEEKAFSLISSCIQVKLHRTIADFENHLDDLSFDFWNMDLTEKLKSFN
ncbi:unnamed protein product [Soboliphyme baturini]|uniref:MPN domain-containing protein n=1 Tax=Soboliphyme baturini TaxID=241478 RepID=A0A183IKF6_9BILA|nr:unnamed protein product [Soboliphyme baturini]